MQYQQFQGRYLIRLVSGELVIGTLTTFLRERGVGFASVTATGAVRWAELAYWNADTQAYEFNSFEEQMEVVGLGGNCSIREENQNKSKAGGTAQGEPFLHIHCVLGRRDFSVIGGHLKEALVYPTLEVWLQTEETVVRRARDEATGLDLLQLAETLSYEAAP